MKIDPKFFESGAVTAISGEFGPMGELAVIKLLCAIRDSGYYLEWSVQRKMMMLRMLPGVTFYRAQNEAVDGVMAGFWGKCF